MMRGALAELPSTRGKRIRVPLGIALDRHNPRPWLRLLQSLVQWVPLFVPSGLTLSDRTGVLSRRVTSSRDKFWTKHFRAATPMSFRANLIAGFCGPEAIRVWLAEHSAVFHLALLEYDSPVAYAKRRIVRNMVEHTLFNVVKQYQGQGVGRRLLANSLATYRQLGINRITLTTGLSSGSQVWPAFGFCPRSEEEWRNLVPAIRDKMLKSDNNMSALDRERVLDALAESDPRAIWRVRDTNPALLAGLKWEAVLDLDDPLSLRRVHSYVYAGR